MTAHDAALARARTPEQQEHLDAVVRAYGLSPTEVARWHWRTVDTFYRKAIDLGLITSPTCEDDDDAEILPF